MREEELADALVFPGSIEEGLVSAALTPRKSRMKRVKGDKPSGPEMPRALPYKSPKHTRRANVIGAIVVLSMMMFFGLLILLR
jgi:hypothetical protein